MLLSGTLADLDLASIAAMTSLGRSSLRLELRGPSGDLIGSLVLKAGRVVSASAAGTHGRAALRVLMSSASDACFQLAREPLDFALESALVSVDELGRFRRAPAHPGAIRRPTTNGDARGDSGARPLARGMRVRMMQGRLDEFDLLTLLQTFGLGRQLVELEIHDRAGERLGAIRVKSGKVVAAHAGDSSGIDAIASLLHASSGFEFTAFRVLADVADSAPVASVAEISVRFAGVVLQPHDDEVISTPASNLDALAPVADPRGTQPSRSDDHITRMSTHAVVMEGTLSDFDMRTILEVLAATRQHACLQVFDPGQPPLGEIAVKAGWIISGQAGLLRGTDAIAFLLRASTRLRFRVLTGLQDLKPDEPLGSIQEVLGAIPISRASRPEVATRILRWAIPVSFAMGGAIVFLLTRGDGSQRSIESPHGQVAVREQQPTETTDAVKQAGSARSALPQLTELVTPSVPQLVATPSVQLSVTPTTTTDTPVAPAPPELARPGDARSLPQALPLAPTRFRIQNAQAALAQLGFDPGPIDNRYGPLTWAAIVKFQRSQHLPITGILDQETWGAIVAELLPQRSAR